MKLDSITIKNFRCFDELTITLHPEMTVLIAPNGSGKTTILDAARIAVWPFVKAFDLGSQAGKSATIQIEDVRLIKSTKSMEPTVPAFVKAAGTWEDDKLHQWCQERDKLKRNTNTIGDQRTKDLTKLGKTLQKKVRDHQPINLPLIVYLGTGRLWYQGRYTGAVADKKFDSSVHSRLWGYQNCITATSSYKQFEDWFAWVFKGYREQQIAQLKDSLYSFDEDEFDKFKAAVTVVQKAVNLLTEKVTGWKNLQYLEGQQQLIMEHAEHGFLPLSLLSDGLRNMTVIVSDIAFRCIKLNPHLGEQAAEKTRGIVMIDEVDMFLHPAWQQRVLGSLREAFPNIQFIVTTHSPQVLSTVPKDCIRILGQNSDHQSVAQEPLSSTYGQPSSEVMLSVMHVDPQPPIEERDDLQQLTEWVDQGDYDAKPVKKKLNDLKQALGAQHPQLQKIERSIRRQEFLKRADD